ncbi:MAG: Na+/H+ antiporter subunit D [Bacteroidetes bacterium]|jgi:multicomponent Na+:H+ antiporter subunit D|nr:Na+/H+ antiporter subunit D [Bacteroidota bacterium]
MTWLLILPVLIPLAAAVASMLLRRAPRAQRVLNVAGTGALLVVASLLLAGVWQQGPQALQVGGWTAPFGITLVADLLGAVMVLITAVVGLAVAVYGLGSIDATRERFYYHPLYQLLLMGVCGAFLTGDLFNLYVWFEVLLIASFVLLVLGNDRAQVRGAVTYVIINLVASLCFLAGVGLLYGLTGTLNMADLSLRLAEVDAPGLVTAIAMLFVIAFGVKAAVFPLFFWLPASYHTPPIAVAAVFAGLLTKVGVYAFLRVFTLLFHHDVGVTHTLLLVVAGLTMVTGVLGAAAQQDVRKILSFHIISQIGYMIMGLALFTPLALVGAIFYIVHHIIVKANLFLVAGVAERIVGSFDLKHLGGLYKAHPWLAILFIIPAFSLAGFPPLSGFWAKLILIKAGLDVGAYVIVGVALVVGLLTLFSMTKIWNGAFWTPLAEGLALRPARRRGVMLMVGPVTVLAVLTLVIGLWAEPFFQFATEAAATLLDRTEYIEAVLGPGAMAATPPAP